MKFIEWWLRPAIRTARLAEQTAVEWMICVTQVVVGGGNGWSALRFSQLNHSDVKIAISSPGIAPSITPFKLLMKTG